MSDFDYEDGFEYGIGQYGKLRNHFENDARWAGDIAQKLLVAYENACRNSAANAKFAVSSGKLSALRAAQHWDAICKTLEAVLKIIPHQDPATGGEIDSDDMIEFGDLPEFE